MWGQNYQMNIPRCKPENKRFQSILGFCIFVLVKQDKNLEYSTILYFFYLCCISIPSQERADTKYYRHQPYDQKIFVYLKNKGK